MFFSFDYVIKEMVNVAAVQPWSYVCVVVQFYAWFKFYFPLFQTHYHTLPYPKTKGNKI